MKWLQALGVLAFFVWLSFGVFMLAFVLTHGAKGAERMIKLQKGDIDTLARTAFGEARGEKDAYRGMAAVALVVLNRAKRGPPQFPATITEVCRAKHQFTCWSATDPNAKVCAAASEANPIFALALHVASGVLTGRIEDFTKGSDHYFVSHMPNPPAWAKKMDLQAVIGNHSFYRSDPVK